MGRRAINICTEFLPSAELDGMRRNYSVEINFDRSALCCFFDLSPYCVMDISDSGDDSSDVNDRLIVIKLLYAV